MAETVYTCTFSCRIKEKLRLIMSSMKNSTATIRVACAIVFLVFVFFYIFCFQTDLLAFAQHVWSGGKTHWDGLVGASIITLLLYLIQVGVNAINVLPKRLHTLTFLPSFLILAALTCINPDASIGAPLLGYRTWICLILIVVSIVFLKAISGYKSMESHLRNTSILSEVSACNFSLLVLMMLITLGIGNTDRTFHQRLKMERCVMERQYEEALKTARMGDGTDPSMTMLCALSLSKKGELGEKFFEYPVVMSSRALLPATNALYKGVDNGGKDWKVCRFLMNDDTRLWRQIGAYPRSEIISTVEFLHFLQQTEMARPAVPDYILTAYLMDGDLDSFAEEIQEYYDITQDKLPKHFKEALVLYTHLHSSRLLTYQNNTLDADYEDFLKIDRKKYSSPSERINALRRSYQGTYWFYYHTKKMQKA